MSNSSLSRRGFIASTLAGGSLLGTSLPGVFSSPQTAVGQEKPRHKVERMGVGAIGLRYQGSVIANKTQLYGDIVAVCDVDRNVRDQAKAAFGSTPHSSEDYQDLLARKDVDVVTIGSSRSLAHQNGDRRLPCR